MTFLFSVFLIMHFRILIFQKLIFSQECLDQYIHQNVWYAIFIDFFLNIKCDKLVYRVTSTLGKIKSLFVSRMRSKLVVCIYSHKQNLVFSPSHIFSKILYPLPACLQMFCKKFHLHAKTVVYKIKLKMLPIGLQSTSTWTIFMTSL